jgi:hypothetical protein
LVLTAIDSAVHLLQKRPDSQILTGDLHTNKAPIFPPRAVDSSVLSYLQVADDKIL